MAWEPHIFKELQQIPREEHVFPGTPLCAGCGGLESLRLASKILGSHVVYVNAAGCFTNLAAFPFTPLDASWLYTTMGSAPGVQNCDDSSSDSSPGTWSTHRVLRLCGGSVSTWSVGVSEC